MGAAGNVDGDQGRAEGRPHLQSREEVKRDRQNHHGGLRLNTHPPVGPRVQVSVGEDDVAGGGQI